MSEELTNVKQGTEIVLVKNLDLAVCLVSVGVRLRSDPPYSAVKTEAGVVSVTYNFHSRSACGTYLTMDLCKAFSEDMKWIAAHPSHPFTFAMVAVKNLESFKESLARAVPFVSFRASGAAVLYVKEGSEKHRRCVAKGMTQI